MAIFDFFKNKKTKSSERAKARREQSFDKNETRLEDKKSKDSILAEKNISSEKAFIVLHSPHFTEKSSRAAEAGVYVFRVAENSNKVQIKEAIQDLYGVNVAKVNVLSARSKKRFSRGKIGERTGYKKAMVFLKAGEKIELA